VLAAFTSKIAEMQGSTMQVATMEDKVAEAQQREGLTSDRATELQKRFEQQTAEMQHWKAKAEVLIL